MKKQIQALACAAMLAVGGFNVYTAMGGNSQENDLKLDGMEMMAEGDNLSDPQGWGHYLSRVVIEWGRERHVVYWDCHITRDSSIDECKENEIAEGFWLETGERFDPKNH